MAGPSQKCMRCASAHSRGALAMRVVSSASGSSRAGCCGVAQPVKTAAGVTDVPGRTVTPAGRDTRAGSIVICPHNRRVKRSARVEAYAAPAPLPSLPKCGPGPQTESCRCQGGPW
eukprot:4093297-Prymnesium_polylepis.1